MEIRSKGRRKWQITWQRTDETGRRTRTSRVVYGTREDAQRLWLAGRSEMAQGSSPTPARVLFRDFCAQWYRDVATSSVRPTTLRSYEYILRVHLVPDLGRIALADLTAPTIQAYIARKVAEPRRDGKEGVLSSSTVRQIHGLLSLVLGQAVEWGMLPQNAATRVKKVKLVQGERCVWTEEQVRSFMRTTADHALYPLFALAITTGMREGELLALRWSDLNMERAILTITQTVVQTMDGRQYGEPKTRQGRRTVAMGHEMVALLRAHRAQQIKERLRRRGPYRDEGLVFATRTGRPVSARNLCRLFAALCERAGVPTIRFHDVRHTCATALLSSGTSPKTVQEMLGHATPAFTLQQYGHALPHEQADAARKMGDRVFGLGGRTAPPKA